MIRTAETIFGRAPDGRPVHRFTIENESGIRFSAIELGATITEVIVPDRRGNPANVVLGYGTLEEYLRGAEFFGCVVGRFANRIAGGRFTLDGTAYTLACNDGPNHSHGGLKGFDKVVWIGRLFRRGNAAGIRFSCTSRNGDQGYPGTCRVTLEYTLNAGNELSLDYRATTDRPTPLNLTNHSYWNLAGSGTVHEQELTLNCPFYLPVDETVIPTGEVLKTEGTPFDFSRTKAIGRDLASVPGGYDHCMVVGKPAGALGLACVARDPASGRAMEVFTTKPGMQLYTANFLDSNPFPRHGACCLETQFFPNSPNVSHFPSCILRPQEIYHHRTIHRFHPQ